MSSARLPSLATPAGKAGRSKYGGAAALPVSSGSFRRSPGGQSSFLRCYSVGIITRATTAGADSGTSLAETKTALLLSLQGIDRGIFGLQSQRRSEIEGLVRQLEVLNPTADPTAQLELVDGSWKLLYSTITILGAKRTKLGLRDFISLGDFFQRIDVSQGKAVNEISFSARGLKMIAGKLTIVASFSIATKTRVDISFEDSNIEPPQLMNLFQKNYDLLLAIFNPEGWLEITFVDESIRIGRDDKGNIFVLERDPEDKPCQ